MKLRILALLLALLSALTLFGCVQNMENLETEAEEIVAETQTETKEEAKEENARADFYGIDWINAVDFGLVGDGETPNDARMQEYIDSYYTIPMYFPEGVYCFEKSLDFPNDMYLQLDPKAELKCIAPKPLEYFISVRKNVSDWCQLDGYSTSYIKGGTINVNYRAKLGIGVCQCYHSKFEGFMLKNVLEKGIQTLYNADGFSDGSFIGRDLVIYNDRAIEGTVGIYDAHHDTNVYETSVVNLETAFYTIGGRFYECTAWNTKMDFVENCTFAEIAGGNCSLFVNCSVDTVRYGYKLHKGANCAVSNGTWITNKNFYKPEMQAKYPRTIFYSDAPGLAQFYVTGMMVPNEDHLSFSNGAMPNSVFLNIRMPGGKTDIPFFRNDSAAIVDLALNGTGSPEKKLLIGSDDFDIVKTAYNYDCEMRIGSGGKGAPPSKETGVLKVEVVGKKVVQTFYGQSAVFCRTFDGAKWGSWIELSE